MPKKVTEAIKQDVRKLVSGVSQVPEAELKDDARFVEDLGVDSMLALEIIAGIEKKYKAIIPEEEIPKIRTLNNVYEILENLLK